VSDVKFQNDVEFCCEKLKLTEKYSTVNYLQTEVMVDWCLGLNLEAVWAVLGYEAQGLWLVGASLAEASLAARWGESLQAD